MTAYATYEGSFLECSDRHKVAAMVMQGMLANPKIFDRLDSDPNFHDRVAKMAFKLADALIKRSLE